MIVFTLNGARAEIAPTEMLAHALRERMGRTETKIGCEIGRCGACTVLLDDAAVNACLLMGWQLDGRSVITIDALDNLAVGQVLAREMEAENAFQCGYCAPGIMMTLAGLLGGDGPVDDEALREALEGNLCRCTGYGSILRGAMRARDSLRAAE